jgi:O-antigen/teichoic acid export membrane protein
MFLNMGMMAALLRYYGAAQTDDERRNVVGTVFAFTVGTGLLVFALGAAGVPTVSRLIFGPAVPATYLLLSFSSFVMNYIGNIPFAYLRAIESSGRVVLIDTLATLGILVLSIVFLGPLKMAILGMLLSPLIVGAIRLVVLIKWMSPGLKIGLDWHLLGRIVRFGFPLVFANLTIFTLNFSDRFFLQRLVSLDVVGIYAVGYKFGYMLNFLLVQSFNMMWQARMYLVYRRPDHQHVFAQVFALYSFVLILAALGLSLFSGEAIRFMVDPRYAGGARIVPVVALAYVFLGVGNYVQLAMYLGHRTGLIGGVSAAAAIINLAANYILISHFGMMGAAAATLIGFVTMAIGSYFCSERVFHMHLPIGRVIGGLCVAIGIYLLGQGMTVQRLPVAIVLKCLLLAGFVAVLRLWLLSQEELGTVESLGKKAASRAASFLRFRSAQA